MGGGRGVWVETCGWGGTCGGGGWGGAMACHSLFPPGHTRDGPLGSWWWEKVSDNFRRLFAISRVGLAEEQANARRKIEAEAPH